MTRYSIALLCALLCVSFIAQGCITAPSARPLAKGEHEVGLSLGGPVFALGSLRLPIPNAVAEGRSGVAELAGRPLDVNYGLNLTALPFGVFQVHGGASWLALEQNGAIPAVSVSDRVFLASNPLGVIGELPRSLGFWAMNQTEVTASWMVGQQLLYVGLGQYTDLRSPALTLTPLVGARFDLGAPGGTLFGLELRWFAVNKSTLLNTVQWVPDSRGAIGIGLGVHFGL